MSNRTKGLLAFLGLVALAAGALALLVAPTFRTDAPNQTHWTEAADLVKREWKPGDVVRIEPSWLTAGRIYFGDLDGGRREPFRILDLHRTPDLPFLMTYGRLWLVSAVDTKHSQWAEEIPGAEPDGVWDFEALTVRRFLLPDDAIAMSLVQDLGLVGLALEQSGKFEPCRLHRGIGALQCGAGGKFDARVELRQIAGGPRRCLLIRPLPDEAKTRLSIPLPSEPGTFFLRFGNTMEAGRQKDGGPVLVTVAQDGEERLEVSLARNDYQLHEAVAPVAAQSESLLLVEVSSSDERKREVCFDGYFVRSPWCDGAECNIER